MQWKRHKYVIKTTAKYCDICFLTSDFPKIFVRMKNSWSSWHWKHHEYVIETTTIYGDTICFPISGFPNSLASFRYYMIIFLKLFFLLLSLLNILNNVSTLNYG